MKTTATKKVEAVKPVCNDLSEQAMKEFSDDADEIGNIIAAARGGKALAELTPEENKAWETAFAFHIDDGKNDNDADKEAWADVVKEFPRLAKFNGAKP